MATAKELLSTAESARLAGVSEETINEYVKFGLLIPLEGQEDPRFPLAAVAEVFRIEDAGGRAVKLGINHENVEKLQAAVEAVEIEALDAELDDMRFSTTSDSLDLIQSNRSLRDQLELLKEERDWLRMRLEKLETRFEREQMLLLSESETIRSLVNQQAEQRMGFWSRIALPWFRDVGKSK